MERTEFQQMMAELKEKSERRRYDALRKKYAVTPDFSNMSLRDEIGVRYDLDELEQLRQKFEMGSYPVDNALAASENKPTVQHPVQSGNMISSVNNYMVPDEVYADPNWGQQTASKLDNYIQNYNSYPGITRTGIVAPFYDMWRNYKTMTDEQNWVGGDNFFHCKANYEAAKRGLWGELVGKVTSAGREMWGQLFKNDPLSDMRKDWHANRMGWRGAKKGLSLEEACPTNPRFYVDPSDYSNIF